MHTYSYNYVHFYCRIHGLLPSLVKFMEGRFHGLASCNHATEILIRFLASQFQL